METIFTSTAAPAPFSGQHEAPISTAAGSIHVRAQAIVDLIKSGFGKGEFAIRCLSLNASSTGRCKSIAKTGSLFCCNHCKLGVIASPELLAVHQIGPEAIRPLIAPNKVHGGVFENKAALDSSKAAVTAPKLGKKVLHNKCKKTNGQVCTTPTRFADGYCHHHRNQLVQQQNQQRAAAAGNNNNNVEQDEDEQEEVIFENARAAEEAAVEDLVAPIATRTRNKRRVTRK